MSNCKCDTSSLKSEKIETLIPDKSNVDIVMGYPANVSIKSRDFAAAQVVNSALGHDTISSRLAAIREKHGLTYGITSSFAETAESFAPWEVDLSVNPENTEKSLKLVREILADYYAKGISARELELEKQRLAGEYVVQRMRSPKRLADALSKYGALGLGPEFMDRYPELLNSVSLKDANAAIKQYMNPDRLLTSLAGSIREKNKSK